MVFISVKYLGDNLFEWPTAARVLDLTRMPALAFAQFEDILIDAGMRAAQRAEETQIESVRKAANEEQAQIIRLKEAYYTEKAARESTLRAA